MHAAVCLSTYLLSVAYDVQQTVIFQTVCVYHNVCCCFATFLHSCFSFNQVATVVYLLVSCSYALYTSCYFMMHAFPMCPIAYHLTQHDVCIPRASTIAVRCSVTYLSCALWFCGLSPCVFLSINLLMCSAYSMFTKHKRNRNSGRKMQFIRLRLGKTDTSCPLVDP